eukprot:COSAG02_NODE_18500_length_935_cov_0.955742_1_plen_194_part_10
MGRAAGVTQALPSRKKKPPALPHTTQVTPPEPEPEPEPDTEPGSEAAKRPPPPLPASKVALEGEIVESDSAAGKNSRKQPPPPLPIVKRPPPRLPTAEELQKFREAHSLEPQGAAELAAWETVRVANSEAAKRIFDVADIDQSGAMDLDEVKVAIERRCPGADSEYVEELIKRFDRDSSGTLDLEEFEDLYTLV